MSDAMDKNGALNSGSAPGNGEALLDKMESPKRHLTGWSNILICGLALTASLFHLYTAAFGQLAAMYQRSWHWLFMGVLLFLRYPMFRNRPKERIDIWDWAFAALMAVGCLNIIINWEAIAMREGAAVTSDVVLGIIMTLLVLEGVRRSMGWPLPIMAIIAIVYALYGRYFPGMLAHRGFTLDELAPFL